MSVKYTRHCNTCKKEYKGFGKKYCSKKCEPHNFDVWTEEKKLEQSKRMMGNKNSRGFGEKARAKALERMLGDKNPMKDPWIKEKVSDALRGVHSSPRTEFKKGQRPLNWKGGISKDKEYQMALRIQKREKLAGRKRSEQCEICGSLGLMCFDHDHDTGKFRGWICHRCNLALGLAKDNVETLEEMIKYLIKNK